MVPSFLHLEDSHDAIDLDALLINGKVLENIDEILGWIDEFYYLLYTKSTIESEVSINSFLQAIPSLPKCVGDTMALTFPIMVKEVEEAIDKLSLNKTPGCHGLTAEFYQHFQQEVSPILCNVYN